MPCNCNQCAGIEKVFNEETARRELEDFRKNGMAKTTRALVEMIGRYGVDGARVLDIGGGVGAIQKALFDAGAAEAISVDASMAYTEAARKLAEEEGYSDRVTRLHGDFSKIGPTLEQADIVTLDRVICCFDDMPALVSASAAKAGRVWGAVYPRDWWIAQKLAVVIRALQVLFRFPMRIYVHRSEDVDAILREHGLAEVVHRNMGFWQVVVYGR